MMHFSVTLSDPSYPKPPHILHFVSPLIILVVGGGREFQFGRYVVPSKF